MTTSEHAKPLNPGEIRRHTVGAQTFTVMHVAGGSFTQAMCALPLATSRVLCTSRFEQDAVRAYADAIEQAEADAADADREDDAPEPLTAEGEKALRVRSGFAPTMPVLQQDSAPAPTLADDPYAERESSVAFSVNVLRGIIAGYIDTADESYDIAVRALDRIAGAVPQRATDADGWGIWLHGCGAAQSAKRGDGICDACGAKTAGTSDWQALYTLGGE